MELKNISNFLTSFVNQTETRKFCYLDEDMYFIKNRLQGSMFNALYSEKYICGMWIYSNTKDRNLWTRIASYEDFNDFLDVKTEFEDRGNLEKYQKGCWQLTNIKDRVYFIYVEYDENICYGSWVNADRILENASNYFKEDNLLFALRTQKDVLGSILYEQELYSGDEKKEVMALLGKKQGWQKMTITCPLESVSGISLEITLGTPFVDSSKWMVGGITILGVITILLISIMCINIRKYLILPVREIVDGIRKIGAGDLEQRINTERYTVEVKEIGDNLNQMTGEVRQLKIKVYEEEIKKKDAQLQFYNVQIRPHFVLNVVNTIYSMASIKEYEGILKTCRYLSGYMRYMFSQKELICTIEEEITHLREYILLQEVRYPDSLECGLELEPQILHCRIPTLSLHSLVENIFKYGIQNQEKLDIQVKGSLLIEENKVMLIVSDNGPGFDDAVIQAVNEGNFTEERHKIGLNNTVLRFRELYQDRFHIFIENNNGAKVELCFPYETEEEAARYCML